MYAPVNNFSGSFDPVQPVNAPKGTVRLFCDRVDLIQSNNPLSPNPRSQFIATGNAQIAADLFASQGDKISYRDDTDEMVVESLTSDSVFLRVRNNSQSNFDKTMEGSRFTYNVRTKTAVAKDVQGLSAPFPKRPMP